METPDEASRKLVRNEQLKLGATLCNTIAAAFIVTGVVIPVIAVTYQTAVPQGRYWAVYVVVWLAVAAFIHQVGRMLLSGIRS